jgi:hypothetical protein
MNHPTVTLANPGNGREVAIDEAIVPLIRLLWDLDVETWQSCEDYDGSGYVWLVLASMDDLGLLLEAVGDPDGPIFEHLSDWEVAAPYQPDDPSQWRYAIGPYPAADDVWPTTWGFCVTVEFLRAQLPDVEMLLRDFARVSGSCHEA